MPFAPASRKHTFALIGLTGHSGTGKTYGALLLAKGLSRNGRVALIDTENGRGSMYSDEFRYDVQELHPPFTPQRYTDLVYEAEKSLYDVLIIDSFSHEWESLGGVLEMAEAGNKKGLQKWMAPKIAHKKMVNALLQSRMHVIICMRGKDKMIQAKDEQGRDMIVNGGVIPIQEKRVIYEMTISLILDESYNCRWGKGPECLRPHFDGKRITTAGGAAIREWLDGGAPVDHDAERLLAQAREQAAYGTAIFREHWKRLSKPQQVTLQPHVPLLKEAAEAADQAMGTDGDHAREPGEEG